LKLHEWTRKVITVQLWLTSGSPLDGSTLDGGDKASSTRCDQTLAAPGGGEHLRNWLGSSDNGKAKPGVG